MFSLRLSLRAHSPHDRIGMAGLFSLSFCYQTDPSGRLAASTLLRPWPHALIDSRAQTPGSWKITSPPPSSWVPQPPSRQHFPVFQTVRSIDRCETVSPRSPKRGRSGLLLCGWLAWAFEFSLAIANAQQNQSASRVRTIKNQNQETNILGSRAKQINSWSSGWSNYSHEDGVLILHFPIYLLHHFSIKLPPVQDGWLVGMGLG